MNIKRYAKTVLVSSVIYILFNYCWLRFNSSSISSLSVFLWCQATAIYTISISIIDIVGFLFDKNWIIEKTLLGIKITDNFKKRSAPVVMLVGFIVVMFILFSSAMFLSKSNIAWEMIKTIEIQSISDSVFPFLHIEIMISIIFSQAIALRVLFLSIGDTMLEKQYLEITAKTMGIKKHFIFDPSHLFLYFPVYGLINEYYLANKGTGQTLFLLCAVVIMYGFNLTSERTFRYCELARDSAQNHIVREKLGFGALLSPKALLYSYACLYLFTAYLQWRRIIGIM